MNQSNLQKAPSMMIQNNSNRTPLFEEESKHFDSLSHTRTPKHLKEMNQMMVKSNSNAIDSNL